MPLSPQDIQHLPDKPGVYFFKNTRGDILYIGKAKILRNRVQQYFTPGSVWKQEMVAKAVGVDFVEVQSEAEALYLENNLIKKHNPPYNSLLKGDNTYGFIKITNEDFPRIFFTRKRANDKATYIGPKHHTREIKQFLQYFRQLFQYRTMSATDFRQGKLTSDFYFGLDRGRSVIAKLKQKNAQQYIDDAARAGLVLNKSYDAYVQEYQDIVRKIKRFFAGDTKPVEKEIRAQIADAVSKEHFERAAKLRDMLVSIDTLVEKQTVELGKNITGYIAKIKPMSGWYVYVIVQFYEGRMIDIGRHKMRMSDATLPELIASFAAEYGDMTRKDVSSNSDHTLPTTLPPAGLLGCDKYTQKIGIRTIREIDILLEKFLDGFVLTTAFEDENLLNDLLSQLQERYALSRFPYRMECVDISHLSGSRMSAGLSCMLGGVKYPHGYRRYKIKSLTGNDRENNDYLAIEEVIHRRFGSQREKDEHLPDIFVIDGGKGQLNVVKKLWQETDRMKKLIDKVQFVSLGKGSARKTSGKIKGATEKIYWFDTNFMIHSKALIYDQVDKILVQLRDEAHRFANTYRKKQMSKQWKT